MNRPLSTATALALALAAPTAAPADVSLPAIFSSHMVLQRDQADRVWGKAAAGEEVTVAVAGQSKATKCGDDGKWMVTLDPMPAGGPFTMTVKGSNTVTFDDVLVGEVWLCSGQSNMEWGVKSARDADLEPLSAKNPMIRLISVPKVGTQEPKDDFKGEWKVCSPETVQGFSAVGYFFGRTIQQVVGVPVGLINDAWGGSACEAWVRRDLLEGDEKYAPLIARWKEIEAKGGPAPQLTGNSRPGNIYNGVLKPTIGYGMRGVIWYQGESNAGRAYQYRDLFPLMIQSWRDEWKIGDFPFYWVQLADYMAEKPEPGDSAWAELREAQTMTMGKLPYTGEAVIIDLGEGKDIHPVNKQGVASRLARWALAHEYGVKLAHHSPKFQSMDVADKKAVLTFEHAGDKGLDTFDVGPALGFTAAGDDKVFYKAEAKVVGKDKIEVTCDKVPQIKSVRYAWADNPVCNVYSSDGLPMTPFRTDDWPGATAQNK